MPAVVQVLQSQGLPFELVTDMHPWPEAANAQPYMFGCGYGTLLRAIGERPELLVYFRPGA